MSSFNVFETKSEAFVNLFICSTGYFFLKIFCPVSGLWENEKKPVAGTPFDFRRPKAIGTDINSSDDQIVYGGGYDHNFILNKPHQDTLSFAASVFEPTKGIRMEIFTTEPAIQFYGGNFMDGSDVGKYGKKFLYRESFALETQHYPDSPNNKSFPNVYLLPFETYISNSIYKFSVDWK